MTNESITENDNNGADDAVRRFTVTLPLRTFVELRATAALLRQPAHRIVAAGVQAELQRLNRSAAQSKTEGAE